MEENPRYCFFYHDIFVYIGHDGKQFVNVVAPATFAVALNPYELPIKTGDEIISTAQVVSRKYGMVNKSSTDKLGTSDANNVKDSFELTGVAAAGKGITGFTFGGTMNEDAEWYNLTKGIKITAVYTSENAPVGAAAMAGTGAVYDNPAPKFTTGTVAGMINYTKGKSGDSITSIILVGADGSKYDGYNALSGAWQAATDDNNGTITFDNAFISGFAALSSSQTATVTYETKGGVTKTTEVELKLK